MLNFPMSRNGWRLDAVSILAVLGESNIRLNAHLICRSWTCLLPRLMPAPQGLLGERMRSLPHQESVAIVATTSGQSRKTGLNYLASIVHGCGTGERPYTVREYRITKNGSQAAEQLQIRRNGPIHIVALVSFVFTIALLVWAVCIGDGPATIGIISMCLATSSISIGCKYHITETTRSKRAASTKEETVIFCNREGVFSVIHCTVGVAEQLYFSNEACDYLFSSQVGRMSGGIVGGLLLIISVVLFGNATWTMQVALALVYALLNVAYWVIAILPPAMSWDTSAYTATKLAVDKPDTYTCAIYCAIKRSNSTAWILENDFLPETPLYKEWVIHAEENRVKDTDWNSFKKLRELRQTLRTPV
jgi:hypothetical protein